jgi:hypothetical protein
VSNGFDNVLIVVDRLTQMANFLPCTQSVTAEENTNLVLQGLYRLHGLPRLLVSNRDPKFANSFWQTLGRRHETRLNMSSSRHMETYGLTERVSNTFQQLLRCFLCYNGFNWTNTFASCKWNPRTTLLVRQELSTLPSRLILGSLLRSLLAYCSARDLQFQFRKTDQSG